MRYLVIVLLLLCSSTGYSAPVGDQFPSSGEELLAGCKLWAAVNAHDCKNKDCDHFTKDEAFRAISTFEYVKGYFFGVRTSQAISGRRLINFPEEGIDCSTLVGPLTEFLEKDAKLRSEHASIALFVFFVKRYPSK